MQPSALKLDVSPDRIIDNINDSTVHFLIKGSKDALIFNTNGFNMALRIKDKNTPISKVQV